MKNLLTIAILAFSFNASAAYVHVAGDNFFTNDVNGQEWLRLDETIGVTIPTVLATHTDYRYATKAEVQDLLNFFFPTAMYGVSTVFGGGNNTTGVAVDGSVSQLWLDAVPYFDTVGSIVAWDNSWEIAKGIYKVNGYHLSGAERLNASRYNDDFVRVSGTEQTTYIQTWKTYPYYGSWLVKDVPAVPVPAAVWLFGSGLLGLVGVARRKKA